MPNSGDAPVCFNWRVIYFYNVVLVSLYHESGCVYICPSFSLPHSHAPPSRTLDFEVLWEGNSVTPTLLHLGDVGRKNPQEEETGSTSLSSPLAGTRNAGLNGVQSDLHRLAAKSRRNLHARGQPGEQPRGDAQVRRQGEGHAHESEPGKEAKQVLPHNREEF